jgi:hypothetical protein
MEPLKSRQTDFNRISMQQSCGMLAPINGTERFSSVSCGYTVQFCKASLASCVIPQTSLADSASHLNVHANSIGDKDFQTMLRKDWEWLQVAAIWPSLPDLA